MRSFWMLALTALLCLGTASMGCGDDEGSKSSSQEKKDGGKDGSNGGKGGGDNQRLLSHCMGDSIDPCAQTCCTSCVRSKDCRAFLECAIICEEDEEDADCAACALKSLAGAAELLACAGECSEDL